jgi:hypothetical protein
MTVWVILKEYYTSWDNERDERNTDTEIYKIFDSHEKAMNEVYRLAEDIKKYGNWEGNHYYMDRQEVY